MTARIGHHREVHRGERAGWLRAAVLGADDGLVSTASLMVGVAAAAASRGTVVTAGLAGLVAGAMSMAAGEYVSVSSQRDVERADLALEAKELAEKPEHELNELTGIYEQRGLPHHLARQVAETLSEEDPLAAHARDELGITDASRARPLQAAFVSAASFAVGGVLPLSAMLPNSAGMRLGLIVAITLAALASLGAIGARVGGAPLAPAAARVVVGGGLAMLVTAGVGRLIGFVGV